MVQHPQTKCYFFKVRSILFIYITCPTSKPSRNTEKRIPSPITCQHHIPIPSCLRASPLRRRRRNQSCTSMRNDSRATMIVLGDINALV